MNKEENKKKNKQKTLSLMKQTLNVSLHQNLTKIMYPKEKRRKNNKKLLFQTFHTWMMIINAKRKKSLQGSPRKRQLRNNKKIRRLFNKIKRKCKMNNKTTKSKNNKNNKNNKNTNKISRTKWKQIIKMNRETKIRNSINKRKIIKK